MQPHNSFVSRVLSNIVVGYVCSAALTLAILFSWHALHRFAGDTLQYIILLPVVALSAWYFGVGPAIVDILLSLTAVEYWLGAWRLPHATQSVCLAAFLLGSAAVISMGEARRLEAKKLHKGQRELEDRVRERTAELDTANASLRELSARLLQLQDEERRRIARELHDSVGQLLAALSMNLLTVRSDIERLAKTASTLADSEGLVQEMSKEVRTISHLLHPPLLDEAGLASAVRWYVDGFAQRSRIKVDLDFPNDFGRLSRESEIAIFRVVQECLTNIHRHSGSLIAKIHFGFGEGQIIVTVEDKGKGVPVHKQDEMASVGAPGVGIRGMRERLRQLGGELEIISRPTGTVVIARLPAEEGVSVTPRTVVDPSPTSTA